MSFSSHVLDRLLREKDWTQTELAARSGVQQSNISRYLNGVPFDAETLNKFAAVFPDYAGELVAAWLHDLTPLKLRPFVSISPADGKSIVLKEEPNALARYSPRVRKLTEQIAQACEHNPKVFAAFQSTMQVIAVDEAG